MDPCRALCSRQLELPINTVRRTPVTLWTLWTFDYTMYKTLFFIGLGSFFGGIFRFLLSRFIQSFSIVTFPAGTLFVNITGCFLIGFLYGLFERGNVLDGDLRLFLTVGLCGGFTTFSTFMNENFMLLRDQEFFYFILYTTLSIVLGLLAVYLGQFLVKVW